MWGRRVLASCNSSIYFDSTMFRRSEGFLAPVLTLVMVNSTSNWVVGAMPVWTAITVTVIFAVLAYLVRGVSRSGAIAGGCCAFILYACAGWGAFAALVGVFLLAWLTTKWGYAHKRELGVAEKGGGRTASQIFANLGVSAAFALLYAAFRHNEALLLAAGASLAEAAADTVSSEFGQIRGETARLITTWQVVPAGTDGGITLKGTAAGLFAAVVVGSLYAGTGEISWRQLLPLVIAATMGFLVDSFLGASLENRELLNNDSVNFLSTLFAALVAVLLAWI